MLFKFIFNAILVSSIVIGAIQVNQLYSKLRKVPIKIKATNTNTKNIE